MQRLIPWITLAWAACFVYLGAVPRVPQMIGVDTTETLEALGHLVATLVLTLLVAEWIRTRTGRSRTQAALAAAAVSVAVALAIEAVQLLRADRSVETIDVALDLAGAGLGALGFGQLRRLRWPGATSSTAVGVVGLVAVGLAMASIVAEGVVPGPTVRHQCVGDPVRLLEEATLTGDGDRVTDGRLVEYRFDEGAGSLVHGGDPALDLVVGEGLRWLEDGAGIDLGDGGLLESRQPAATVAGAVAATGELTVEAWVRPRFLQAGPARVVSISAGPRLDQIDVQVGQEASCLSYRIRQGPDGNAEWVVVESVFAPGALRHLAVTYAGGEVRAYVNGELIDTHRALGSSLEGWDAEHHLLVGNEATGDRPFAGEVFLVALYDRALSREEVGRNVAAGARPGS